jgi:RNA polymerase sigma-70 factor (ECF subfamily)
LDRMPPLEALDAGYDRHFLDLVRLSRALGAGADAEDLAQDAMLYARSHVGQLRDSDRLTGWLRSIAARKTFRLLRSPRRRQLDWELYAPVGVSGDQDLRLDLAGALHKLPPRERAAITLVYMLGYPEEAAAEVLGIRRGTVAASLSHARGKLATSLIEYERKRGGGSR